MPQQIKSALKPNDIRSASRFSIYPFFMFHMLMFGVSGFFLAYAVRNTSLLMMYLHGGIAIFAYVNSYLTIFGRDQVKWMFINAALGILGIYSQIGWILRLFGKRIEDYPWYVHITPFLYYVLYTFLLRQLLIDIARARDNPQRRARVDVAYVALSVLVYLAILWKGASAAGA